MRRGEISPIDLTVVLSVLVLLLMMLCSCAGKNFNHIPVDRAHARKVFEARKVWSGPCYEARVKRAYEILRDDDNGRPWVFLYWSRCTQRDDWVGEIIPRRGRHGWWRRYGHE
jgi:hypothetical protein